MRRLRVGIVLEQPVEVGGGFQQSLTDLLWFCEWAKSTDIDTIVLTPHPSSISILADFGISAKLQTVGKLDHLYLLLKYFRPFDLVQRVLRIKAPFEKQLMAEGADIIYFTTPSHWHMLLNKLPFIITIFDGSHRDSPEFDEVREFGEFERREMLFRSAATKAALVVTNATELIDALCYRYGMERERAVCIPFSPSAYLTRTPATDAADAAVLAKHGLKSDYLFYPAQFWSHKNHGTLLAALALLKAEGRVHRLVLCGSDRGARSKVVELIGYYGLQEQVSVIGFVDSGDLGALYRNAAALVMPSYFGPTNLPPLEAWATDTPVLYPEAFKVQVADAAILFDYDDPRSLAEAVAKLDSAELLAQVRLAGANRLGHFIEQISAGHQDFARKLKRLLHRISLAK